MVTFYAWHDLWPNNASSHPDRWIERLCCEKIAVTVSIVGGSLNLHEQFSLHPVKYLKALLLQFRVV